MPSPVRSALKALSSTGTNPAELPELRLDLKRLGQTNYRIPAFLSRHVWDVLSRHSQLPLFGLAAARHVDPGQLAGLPYLMQLLPSRLEALQTMIRYWPLVASHMELDLHEEDGKALLSVHAANGLALSDSEQDYWAARQIQHLRTPAGASPALLEVHIRRPRPSCSDAWEELAGVPVIFNAPRDVLWMDLKALKEPRPGGSETIRNALQQALDTHAWQAQEGSLLERVADMVMNELHHDITQEAVADRLHITPRTLHRTLVREGWSFSEIVDCHRRYLAHDRLIRGNETPGDVADSLGYREVTSFNRAFKRWFGASPKASRPV